MPETVAIRVNGRPVVASKGISLAAALENAGQPVCRRSVSGEGRGVLCAMGICFECRVTIDGAPHQRACMILCRDGMDIAACREAASGPLSAVDTEDEGIECDVAVVGAGPAGIAAACRAAESGARTAVLDEGLVPGGQIHRHLPGREVPEAARPWIERLARAGAALRTGMSVFDAERGGDGWRLFAESMDGKCEVRARRVILATGARELFLPFPGWTLPGVLGAGGAQALWKAGASLRGRRAVVAGSGPLLLPVAASLARAGAELVLVAEQAGMAALFAFGAQLARSPGKILEAARYRRGFLGARYRTGTWVVEAFGKEKLEGVALTSGRGQVEVACDLAAVAYGLVPNTELARLLGCDIRAGAVVAGAAQESSVAGIACAGEPCGVAGLDVAIAEGEIAGLAAAGRFEASSSAGRQLSSRRARGRRCEDARFGDLVAYRNAREAKLATRAGMGPCQGRVCGPALGFLFGWDSDTVRPPVKPVLLGRLASREETA